MKEKKEKQEVIKTSLPSTKTKEVTVQKAIETYNSQVDKLLKEIGVPKITDDKSRESVSKYLSRLSEADIYVEEKRKGIVKPHNDYVIKINSLFKAIGTKISLVKDQLKGEITRDFKEQERIRIAEENKKRAEEQERIKEQERILADKRRSELSKLEAQQQIEKIQEEKKVSVQENLPVTKIRTMEGSTQIRKTWTFEVVDFAKLPDTYKIANDSMIRNAMKVRDINNVPVKIAGVEFKQEVNVSGGR